MPYVSAAGNQVKGVNFNVRVYPSTEYEDSYVFYLDVEMDSRHKRYLAKKNQLPENVAIPLHELEMTLTNIVKTLEVQEQKAREALKEAQLKRIETQIQILTDRYTAIANDEHEYGHPININEMEDDDYE